jgi:O-antigen ligase
MTSTLRLRLIQIGILATFAMVPVWKRFSVQEPPPLLLPNLYVSYFWILIPMLWSIAWWLVAGLPGFTALRRDALRAGWALALLLMALWTLASPLWAFMRDDHPEVAATASLQFGVVALFTIVVACAAPSPRAIVMVLIIGALWNGVLALFQVANQGAVGLRILGEFPISLSQPGVSIVQSGAIRWLRPYGLMVHPNILAGFLTVGLLASLSWVLSRRRLVWWAGVVIFVIAWWALLLTFSRGAWIGFAVGAFTTFLFFLRFSQLPTYKTLRKPFFNFLANLATVRKPPALLAGWRFKLGFRLLYLFIAALIVTIPFIITFRPLLAARTGVGEESIELRSISDRMIFADFAYSSILERPIIGVGIGNFPWRSSYYIARTTYDLRGDHVHHVYLYSWAELGVVGFGLLIIALELGIASALRTIRKRSEPLVRPPQIEDSDILARIVLLAGFLALTFIGLLDHYPWTLIQCQALWWGLLAASSRSQPGLQHVVVLPTDQDAP